MERKHRVRLTAAKIRLKSNDRVASGAGDALQRTLQQPRHAVRHKRAAKELVGLLVLGRGLAAINLRQIGGELGLLDRGEGGNLFHQRPSRASSRD